MTDPDGRSAADDEFASGPELGPGAAVTSRAEYFDRWSQLHGGVDPAASWLTRGWLSFAYGVASPLARLGFSPNGVTVLGALIAAAAPLLAWLSVDQPDQRSLFLWLAVVACAVGGLADNLDGAVAVITGRTSRWGYVLDSLVDRLSDCALLLALWFVGAPGAVCLGAALLTMLQEYSRARAGAAGMSEVGVVSIWERPTRIIVVAVFLGLAAWAPYGLTPADWVTIGAWLGLGLAAVGFAQVTNAVYRKLR